jgi:hypothetical protein
MKPEESRLLGYACVISGMLAQGTIGIVQLWGNITVYITSYLRSYDHSITMEDTYPVFAISIFIGAVFMQVGSLLMTFMHPRVQIIIGGLGLVIPLFLCSYLTNFYQFIILYSFGTGFAFGVLYMPALKHSWVYFPSRKGLVSGIILSFYSIGSIIAVIVA